ncbi:MAG: hypothetical protein ACFFBD_21900 [Candidatus Hodarchaeota archaeon]
MIYIDGLIASLYQILLRVYTLALLVIIYYIWNSYSQRSHQSGQVEELDGKHVRNKFKKAKTEYIDPPRPHSHSFKNYFGLASLKNPLHYQKMAFTLSNLIKDNIKLLNQTRRIDYSENLSNLMNNPREWLNNQYDQIAKSGISNEKYTSEFFYEQFNQILNEVEQIISTNFP